MEFLRYRFEYIVFCFAIQVAKTFGFRNSCKAGKLIGDMMFYLLPWRKKVALTNARIIGVKDPYSVVRSAYRNFAEYFIEAFSYPPQDDIKKIFDGQDILPFCEDRNIIFLSAHFGNWEVGTLFISSFVAPRGGAVARRLRNPYINSEFVRARERFGLKIIYDSDIRGFINHLRRGGVLFFLADQSSPSDEFTFDFFGVPATWYNGPFSLAYLMKSKMVFAVPLRAERALERTRKSSEQKETVGRKEEAYKPKYVIRSEVIFDRDEVESAKNKKAFVQEGIKRYISLLQEVISAQPDNYFLFHKRWKRPRDMYR